MDWTSGYVADVGYTFGYYPELSPQRAQFALLYQGIAPPDIARACELGFGQGLSVNFHTASGTTKWFGTDFNPTQAAFAQQLSRVAGTDAQLADASFEEFAARTDLPKFQFIGLHGIWSWVSDANRRIIVDFVRRNLDVGGILYISYNTLPGWSQFAPIRHLLTEHAKVMTGSGVGIVKQIDASIEFAQQVLETNPQYAQVSPQLAPRMERLKTHSRHYLAHEYFNRDWHPMYYAQMQQWLESAKLQFVCSAYFPDHTDIINLTAPQIKLLQQIPDVNFRQTLRDFIVNQPFRRDLWVRGPRVMAPAEREHALRRQRLVLSTPRVDVPMKVLGSLGEVGLLEEVCAPVLDALADYRVRAIDEVAQACSQQGQNFAKVLNAIVLLIGSGHLSVAQSEDQIQAASSRCWKLNQFLMDKAKSVGEINYLVSPVTATGYNLGRFPQLFLLAEQQGLTEPRLLAEFVWSHLKAVDQRVLKDAVVLEDAAANIAELEQQAKVFVEKQHAICHALKLVAPVHSAT